MDEDGAKNKTLLVVGDNSFCNRTVFGMVCPRTEIVARARRDIKLCRRASTGSRCFYDAVKFTPEQVRQDEHIAWSKARIFYGGQ